MSIQGINSKGTPAGFTLIELMVTVSVIGIVALVAIPSMQGLMFANRLSGASGEMSAALQLARSEATRRNARVTVCRSTDGTTCASGTAWDRWIVRGEANPAPTPATAVEILRDEQVPANLDVSGPTGGVIFSPSGMATAQQVVTVCVLTTNPADNQRVLTVNVSGGVIATKANGSGACP